jgi:hypothetical protein
MGAGDAPIGEADAGESSSAVATASPFRIFISYRRTDSGGDAMLLYRSLTPHFGAENVFLDVEGIHAGTRWLDEIKSFGARSGVVLAVIGTSWLATLEDRQQFRPDEPTDHVEEELEFALDRWAVTVIPVLVGGARMPSERALPRPLQPLAACQSVELRLKAYDEDVARLIEQLDRIAAEPKAAGASEQTAAVATAGPAVQVPAPKNGHGAPDAPLVQAADARTLPGPDAAHYDTVLQCMIEQGSVVPLLGSQVRGSLPDAEELADHLVGAFRLGLGSRDLAEIAQRVAVGQGPSFLYKAMAKVLGDDGQPDAVCAFLAGFPKRASELGRPAQYQMIITTNYDTALERAFDAAGEKYDLAVFQASGPNKGKFIHIPWKDKPCLIDEPIKYRAFPIDKYDDLKRTVIVKLNGATDAVEGDYSWDENYVVTEDQYIDYLVTEEIGRVVPYQILNKLTGSHCLFIGYAVRDWSSRVFLKRVWPGDGGLKNKSWAIERCPDALEKDRWESLKVELLAAPPPDYVNELSTRMAAWT